MGKEIIQEKRAPFEVWAGNLHNSLSSSSFSLLLPLPPSHAVSSSSHKEWLLLFFFVQRIGSSENTSLFSASQLAKLLGKTFPGVKKDKQIGKHKEWINWGFNSVVSDKVKDVALHQAFHCNTPPIKPLRTSNAHSTSQFSEGTGACHRCLRDLLAFHRVKNTKKKLPGRITSSSQMACWWCKDYSHRFGPSYLL